MQKLSCSMIKRIAALLLALLMLLPGAVAEDNGTIQESEGFILQEESPASDAAADQPVWDFPIALSAMKPEFVILANKSMLIPKSYVVKPLVAMKTRKSNKDGSNKNGGVRKVSGTKMQLNETAAAALVRMMDAANDQGMRLYLKSAYRSYQTQKTMYYNRLKKNHGKDDGWVMLPGSSDHQTGLGMDVVSHAWRSKPMNGKFGDTEEARWMAEHGHAYGFILRYPADKTELTQINYEPWHLRYVGVEVATYMYENGLCLEEFHDQLNAAMDAYVASGGSEADVSAFRQVSADNGK